MKLTPLRDAVDFPESLYVVMRGEDEWMAQSPDYDKRAIYMDLWAVGVDSDGVAWTYCTHE